MFFVFKHKTAYEMRISDWISDLCSSDLVVIVAALRIDRDAADVGRAGERERIGGGGIAHSERDHRADLGPQPFGRGAVVRALLNPDHVAVAAVVEQLA